MYHRLIDSAVLLNTKRNFRSVLLSDNTGLLYMWDKPIDRPTLNKASAISATGQVVAVESMIMVRGLGWSKLLVNTGRGRSQS